MSSIQDELDRIAGAKTTLGNYLAQNGVTVPSGTKIEEMALLLADVIEKQNKITASGILKGDGEGNVTAATAGTDYADISESAAIALVEKMSTETTTPQDSDYFICQTAGGNETDNAIYRRKSLSTLWEWIKSKLSTDGNAATAVKLKTSRKIAVSGGAATYSKGVDFDGSSNIALPIDSVYGAYITWGGKNITEDVSCIDAAMSDVHSANRAAFMKPAGITIEYSTDAGATWVDYNATDSQKIALVSNVEGQKFDLGGPGVTEPTADARLRITIDAYTGGFYTLLKTVLIHFTNAGKICTVTVEESKNRAPDEFTEVISAASISGWSGWNSYPIKRVFGGLDYQTANIRRLRFTFATTEAATQCIGVINMRFLGTTYWICNSEMARSGKLYAYDSSQNATFPANVKAKGNFLDKNGNPLASYATATGTLTSAGWSDNTQTISVSGVTTSNMVIVTYAPESRSDYMDADILLISVFRSAHIHLWIYS